MRPYLLLALLAPFLTAQAAPVPSTYTYQGELRENGAPRNGTVDLRFRVYDLPTGGSQYNIVAVNDVPVSNGLFTAQVPLDTLMFFEGGEWWLSVEVREGSLSGAEPYVLLSPRQSIAAVPYATNAQAVGGLHASDLLKAPGQSAFKRVTFYSITPAAVGWQKAVDLTLAPPGNGALLVQARGYCYFSSHPNNNNEVKLAIGSTASEADLASSTDVAELLVPPSDGHHALMFSAERTFVVQVGTPFSTSLFAKRASGPGAGNCFGSMTGQFFPATLQ